MNIKHDNPATERLRNLHRGDVFFFDGRLYMVISDFLDDLNRHKCVNLEDGTWGYYLGTSLVIPAIAEINILSVGSTKEERYVIGEDV